MTSALRLGGWVVSTTPRPLYPRERPGTHCTGGWVGPRAGLDGGGKSRPHRDSIPGPSSPQGVAIPTELSRPLRIEQWAKNKTAVSIKTWKLYLKNCTYIESVIMKKVLIIITIMRPEVFDLYSAVLHILSYNENYAKSKPRNKHFN